MKTLPLFIKQKRVCIFRVFVDKMAKSGEALDRVRKQLRSVLISEKHGVAVERVERDYLELVRSC